MNSNVYLRPLASGLSYQESATNHDLYTRRNLSLAALVLVAIIKNFFSERTDKAETDIQKIQARADILLKKHDSQIQKEKILHVKEELNRENSALKRSDQLICTLLTTHQKIHCALALIWLQIKEDCAVKKDLIAALKRIGQENELKFNKECKNYAATLGKIYKLEKKLGLILNANVWDKN